MSYQDLLMKIVDENNGYLDTSLALSKGVSSTILTTFKRKNNLVRITQGLYKLPDAWDDELYVISNSNPRAVFSHETALYLHSLMDREPLDISVTVKAGYNATHLRKKNIRVYQLDEEKYELGQSVIQTAFGHDVKVYDLERSVCDLVRNKDKTDVQIYSTAWKNYLSRADKNISKLMRYAKEFNIQDIVRGYLEVVLW
ncbi:abortive phage infection protein [Mycoplasma zalophidermidis]|uniref:Abortive phage infection protein n=3 Tax=Mycoplasma TaxID=2093 RepID=A0A6M4JCJ9_9MOLU|nr:MULTISPECIES: abortive phage infection protein [Mycoplasma]MBU4693955.1 abortive phage infection protein [Mycoplasma zalophidermidis]QJR43789.1 abortive phage infection protein [Mycoplasma miroungigenitalium]